MATLDTIFACGAATAIHFYKYLVNKNIGAAPQSLLQDAGKPLLFFSFTEYLR